MKLGACEKKLDIYIVMMRKHTRSFWLGTMVASASWQTLHSLLINALCDRSLVKIFNFKIEIVIGRKKIAEFHDLYVSLCNPLFSWRVRCFLRVDGDVQIGDIFSKIGLDY